MKAGLTTTIVVFLFLSAAGTAQDAVYRYEKGKEYKYFAEMKSEMIQEHMGQTVNVTIEGTSSFAVLVDNILENGDMHVTQVIDNALLIIESPQDTKTFGSDLAGKTFGFTMKNNGEIVEKDSIEESGKSESKDIVRQLQGMFEKFEAGKLIVGSEWEAVRIDTSGTGEEDEIIAEKTTLYKVVGTETKMDRECLHIALVTESELEGTMVRGGQEFLLIGEQKIKGTIYYDQKEGIILESSEEQSSESTISDPGGSMKVLLTAITTSKLEFIP